MGMFQWGVRQSAEVENQVWNHVFLTGRKGKNGCFTPTHTEAY
jgi:hypothetical protein